MKRILALILSLMLTLSAAAFAEDALPDGRLYMNGETETESREKAIAGGGIDVPDVINFDNLSAMLMALKSGRVGRIHVPEPVGQYIAAHNDDFAEPVVNTLMMSFCMATRAENTGLLDKLNAAIESLQASGEIDALYEKCVANIASNPVPAELPAIENAETVKIVVTGDLPPFDYVGADGQPAGFNIELLSAIAKAASINFELELADAGSRSAMVASGRADVIFWMQQLSKPGESEDNVVFTESVEGLALTEAFLKVRSSTLSLQ